jgi:hypothetical protein
MQVELYNMNTARQSASTLSVHSAATIGDRILDLKSHQLYHNRPDFRTLVDMYAQTMLCTKLVTRLESVPGLQETLDSVRVRYSITLENVHVGCPSTFRIIEGEI